MLLTVQLGLKPTPAQADGLRAYMQGVNAAAAYAAATGFEAKATRRTALHRLVYRDLRTRFNLPAQAAVRAIGKAVEAFTRDAAVCPIFRSDGAVPYDARGFTLKPGTVSLLTLAGRVCVSYRCGPRQTELLKGKTREADLVELDGCFYLLVTVEAAEASMTTPDGWLGVDLGVANLAVTSDGEVFAGEVVTRNRRRRMTARKQYQRAASSGSRRAKRKLKTMAGRQSRFQKGVNHTIAKQIVAHAKALGHGLALEDLTGLRERTEPTVSKRLRRRLGNWGFAHLRHCLQYKAALAGVAVSLVDPAYTSQTCSVCGHCEKGNRQSQALFSCKACGFTLHADQNAALNLSARAACQPALQVAPSKRFGG